MKPTPRAACIAAFLACLLGAGCSVTQSDPFLVPFAAGPDRPANLEVHLTAPDIEGTEAVVLTVGEIRFRRAGVAAYEVAVGPWATDLRGSSEHPRPLVRLDPAPGRYGSLQLLVAGGEMVTEGGILPIDLDGALLEVPGPLEIRDGAGTVLTVRLSLQTGDGPARPAVEAVELSEGRLPDLK
jgi:hypothetical protein